MELSAEEMERLLARYELWGVDKVREELAREDRELFSSPEMTEFAEAWIEAQELRERHRRQGRLAVAAVCLAALGTGLGVSWAAGN